LQGKWEVVVEDSHVRVQGDKPHGSGRLHFDIDVPVNGTRYLEGGWVGAKRTS
jgi:hypothetical protein